MDAKELHGFISGQSFNSKYLTPEHWQTILSALSLAAAVEGSPESMPETDAFLREPIQHSWNELCAFLRDLERQRNAALRALKAERELLAEACHALRMNDDDLQCETANKINAALAAQEGRHD